MKTRFMLSALTTALLAGCGADDNDYKLVDKKPEQITRDALKTDQVYLYMPSMGKAPRYAVSMAPFIQGQEKLVRVIYTEAGLEVREISPDAISQAQLEQPESIRWNDVESHLSPVLTIPGSYQAYQCKEDAFGDCTNQEEENSDPNVQWKDKPFFTPDFTQVKVTERVMDDLFTYSNGCYTPVGAPRLAREWQGYEVSPDGSINLELEQDYQITNKRRCLLNALFDRNDFNFSKLSFTVSNFYSLVPLDNIRSKDYDPVLYPEGDENQFGMFATYAARPNHHGNSYLDDSNLQYMHRFNPAMKSIDYHLSDSFNLNENTRFYKQITIDVVNRINPQLQKVGVPPIRLHEPSGKHSGDLRYNVINLIDEPLENGLAGYGPSAVNPVTGEIVHAHVNQYSGVLETGVHAMWDFIATAYNGGTVQAITFPAPAEAPSAEPVAPEETSHSATAIGDVQHTTMDTLDIPPAELAKPTAVTQDLIEKEMQQVLSMDQSDLSTHELLVLQEIEQRFWSENNMYPVSALWSSATQKVLPEMTVAGLAIDFRSPNAYVWRDESRSTLKQWNEFDPAQQHHIGRVLAGIFYAKTLVHELGHNLGLRHNFKGSNDEPNFFTQEQAHDHGLKTVPAYSSIMDYNPSILDALPVFGMYDLATLRFAYKRELEYVKESSDPEATPAAQYFSLRDYDQKLHQQFFDPNQSVDFHLSDGVINAALQEGQLHNQHSKDSERNLMRKFKFCTDGHVSLNTDCNRHDEGRNHAEINAFNWQRYDEQLTYRTTRSGRKDFDENSLSNYALGRYRTFMSWRDVIETFNRHSKYVKKNGASYRIFTALYHPGCTTAPKFKPSDFAHDLHCGVPTAVDQLRHRLMRVILEPDHVCELKDTAENTFSYQTLQQILETRTLRYQFEPGEIPQSCFHPLILAHFADQSQEVTAEAGRMLNSGKAPVTRYNKIGEFDYYGFWPDKFAAMATLVERQGLRRTTQRADLSLADLQTLYLDGTTVRDEDGMKVLLDDILFGTATSYQKYHADLFTDRDGNPVTPQGEFTWFETNSMIEEAPLYASRLKRLYDLPESGKYSQIEALLNIVVKFSLRHDNPYSDGIRLARYISVRGSDNNLKGEVEYERKTGELVYATRDNAAAYKMISSIHEYADLIDESIDNTTLSLKYLSVEDFNDPERRAVMDKMMTRYHAVLAVLPTLNR
ncbi:zinc-dependent metalloprotease [Photobacterium sp. GJ3]|uniref:zinc-dependent metalloprotease n=1 Tax=Photobacterium sp. GJ3 TaxID=2829502 RepID=UPI001B8B6234|nr:zinc-dependent metalloprotease [Photobacterium sp. GJ3]QUJ66875.1 zinc-dependent metalloprotease [Photobacterium sp. GJ3]